MQQSGEKSRDVSLGFFLGYLSVVVQGVTLEPSAHEQLYSANAKAFGVEPPRQCHPANREHHEPPWMKEREDWQGCHEACWNRANGEQVAGRRPVVFGIKRHLFKLEKWYKITFVAH